MGDSNVDGLQSGTATVSAQMRQGHGAKMRQHARRRARRGGATLVRGMMCTWLVCLGVWQATAAQDIIGKIVGTFCAPHTMPRCPCIQCPAACQAGWGSRSTAVLSAMAYLLFVLLHASQPCLLTLCVVCTVKQTLSVCSVLTYGLACGAAVPIMAFVSIGAHLALCTPMCHALWHIPS